MLCIVAKRNHQIDIFDLMHFADRRYRRYQATVSHLAYCSQLINLYITLNDFDDYHD